MRRNMVCLAYRHSDYWASVESRSLGYKKSFMLNSVEHEIFPAYKC